MFLSISQRPLSRPGPPLQRSNPPPPRRLSLPPAPLRRSLPPWPRSLSLPGPPLTLSFPAPAQTRSLPPRPATRSLPPSAATTSLAAVPVRTSFPLVPTTVATRPLHITGGGGGAQSHARASCWGSIPAGPPTTVIESVAVLMVMNSRSPPPETMLAVPKSVSPSQLHARELMELLLFPFSVPWLVRAPVDLLIVKYSPSSPSGVAHTVLSSGSAETPAPKLSMPPTMVPSPVALLILTNVSPNPVTRLHSEMPQSCPSVVNVMSPVPDVQPS